MQEIRRLEVSMAYQTNSLVVLWKYCSFYCKSWTQTKQNWLVKRKTSSHKIEAALRRTKLSDMWRTRGWKSQKWFYPQNYSWSQRDGLALQKCILESEEL
jgi:hypothetical protein